MIWALHPAAEAAISALASEWPGGRPGGSDRPSGHFVLSLIQPCHATFTSIVELKITDIGHAPMARKEFVGYIVPPSLCTHCLTNQMLAQNMLLQLHG